MYDPNRDGWDDDPLAPYGMPRPPQAPNPDAEKALKSLLIVGGALVAISVIVKGLRK